MANVMTDRALQEGLAQQKRLRDAAKELRNERVLALLRREPDWSYHTIAAQLGLGDATVEKIAKDAGLQRGRKVKGAA